MKVMLDEARRLREEPIGAVELAGDKSILLTHFYQDNEATDGQAELLGDAEIIGGDWHLVRTLSDRVKAVTAADIQAFARKHLTRLQTEVLGDPKTIDEAMLKSL
jgi:zinc protease